MMDSKLALWVFAMFFLGSFVWASAIAYWIGL